MERSTELAQLVQEIYDAVSAGDTATLENHLSAREGLVFIGTDPDEWFDDRASITSMLAAQAAAGIKVKGGAIKAYTEGTVGWAADSGAFVLPDGNQVPFRLTVVAHRESGTWKLVQEHASVAIPNTDAIGSDLA